MEQEHIHHGQDCTSCRFVYHNNHEICEDDNKDKDIQLVHETLQQHQNLDRVRVLQLLAQLQWPRLQQLFRQQLQQ